MNRFRLHFISIVILLCFTISSRAQNLVYDWTVEIDDTSNSASIKVAHASCFDSFGNVYVCGRFSGNGVDFDPGPGTHYLSSATSSGFVEKLDRNGNMIWVHEFGTNQSYMYSIAIDAMDNIYCTGTFKGTFDFDPGPGVANITAASQGSAVALKLNSSGAYQNAVAIGSNTNYFAFTALACDSLGNTYYSGQFLGTMDFNPGSGVFNMTSAGNADICVLALDNNLNFRWAAHVGGSGDDNGAAIDVHNNKVAITGYFAGTADFDPGAATANLTSNGSNDIYALILDAGNGNYVNAISTGSYAPDAARGIRFDASGNVLLAGEFNGQIDCDPGSGSVLLTTNGGLDALIWKLSSNLTYIDAISFGSAGTDYAQDVMYDNTGNIYATGIFSQTADLDPGPGMNLQSTVGRDYFFCKYTSSMDLLEASRVEISTAGEQAAAISININSTDEITLCGLFTDTADMNPLAGTDVFLADNAGFITKIHYCSATYLNLVVSTCDSYTVNNVTYTSTGLFSDTITNAQGCDSIITLDLEILGNSYFNSTSATTCDSFQWNNQTYYNSGVFYDSLTTISGCDSVYELVLTVNHSSPLTTVNIAGCDSAFWNNFWFTTSGTGTYTFTNISGCDSNVTVNVTVDSHPDTSVAVTNWPLNLFSNASGVTYQWINCSTGQPISGATGQTYVPTANGTYAVILHTPNGCIDTSACKSVTTVGITELNSGAGVYYYPNPASHRLNISAGTEELIQADIHDMTGKQVKSEQLNGSLDAIDISELPDGIYQLQILTNQGIHVGKISVIND